MNLEYTAPGGECEAAHIDLTICTIIKALWGPRRQFRAECTQEAWIQSQAPHGPLNTAMNTNPLIVFESDILFL